MYINNNNNIYICNNCIKYINIENYHKLNITFDFLLSKKYDNFKKINLI